MILEKKLDFKKVKKNLFCKKFKKFKNIILLKISSVNEKSSLSMKCLIYEMSLSMKCPISEMSWFCYLWNVFLWNMTTSNWSNTNYIYIILELKFSISIKRGACPIYKGTLKSIVLLMHVFPLKVLTGGFLLLEKLSKLNTFQTIDQAKI